MATGETVVRARTDTAGRGEWVEDAEVSDEKDLSEESRRVLEQLLALDEDDDAKIMSSRDGA